MGPKDIDSGELGEYMDRKILEAWVLLSNGHQLSIGLLVDAYMHAAKRS
jgi:hypothetical protein